MRPAPFVRPVGTTANPRWWAASRPEELVPLTADPMGFGAEMCRYFGNCVVTQGPAAGRELREVAMPWQLDFVRYVFGQLDANGEREVRRVFLKMSKGGSKSATCAFLALAWCIWLSNHNLGHRGLILCLGPTLAVANILFQHLEQAIMADPVLRPRFKSRTAQRMLVETSSGIQIVAATANLAAVAGRRPLGIFSDETWLSSIEVADFSAVMDQARRGSANWGSLALEVHLTTSPTSRAVGEYRSLRDYARKVRDGQVHDPATLPLIFEWPVGVSEWEGVDYADSRRWWIACPAAFEGGPLPLAELERELADARRKGAAAEVKLFLSQRLGIEPDSGAAAASLLQSQWPQVKAPEQAKPPASEIRCIALDPGGVADPFAVALVWSNGEDVPAVKVEQFLAKVGYDEASDALRETYDRAIACGELAVLPSVGAVDDAVIALIRGICAHASPKVGGDRFGRAGLVQRLEAQVIGAGAFIEVRQGWSLVAAYEALEACVSDGTIRALHTPLLDENIANLRLEDGPSGRRFAKLDAGLSGQGDAKIDGAMALLSSIDLWFNRGGADAAQQGMWVG